MSENRINVSTSHLDEACKATIEKLKAGGWVKAGEPYVVAQTDVSPSELEYLQTHGGLTLPGSGSPHKTSVLQSVTTQSAGPDSDKVGFKLNVDLQ